MDSKIANDDAVSSLSRAAYTLKPSSTPLPSQVETEAAKQGSEQPATPQFRDITEDDDGYHPYADVPDTRPLFEPNPWD